LNKREEIFSVPFIARHEAPELLQPREDAFYFPAAAVAPRGPTILGDGSAAGFVRRDELNPAFRQVRIETVAVVAAIADEPTRQPLWEKALLQRVVDERDFAGIRTCDSNGEGKTSAVCDRDNLRRGGPLNSESVPLDIVAPNRRARFLG
jgi:hypothetical protein